MEITKFYNWNRRDFTFNAKCEHCGHEEKGLHGYDDANYYNNVVPGMKCANCMESTNSVPKEQPIKTFQPRYPANLTI